MLAYSIRSLFNICEGRLTDEEERAIVRLKLRWCQVERSRDEPMDDSIDPNLCCFGGKVPVCLIAQVSKLARIVELDIDIHLKVHADVPKWRPRRVLKMVLPDLFRVHISLQ